jgi:hypothetical protein
MPAPAFYPVHRQCGETPEAVFGTDAVGWHPSSVAVA